jgi:predicted glycogen debranching enzyme
MLPNRFTDIGDAAEYNAVDASLWFVVAVQEYMAASASAAKRPSASTQERLWRAVEAILTGYRHGTRFGIRMDSDGLLAAGEPGLQLTWMDAKVGNHVVTPRIGKPVEIQALWLNALRFGATRDAAFDGLFEHGLASFRTRFWREDSGCLYDVVDVDHVPGRVDAAFRPNQIFAVGGLPVVLLEPEAARRLIAAVEDRLLTPLGLRSLAPGEDGYRARFQGGVFERDTAYHQGTVWPWLMGSFVEAWLRVHGSTAQTRATARSRFLEPLLAHAEATAGVGHVSEVADAEAPHRPGGCPFQAWSLGELLRALRLTDPSADAAEEPSA